MASLVEAVMRLCPRAMILATSREVMRIEGESVYRVPPLDILNRAQETPDSILGCSAVELFVTRTRAPDMGFAPLPEDMPSIADRRFRFSAGISPQADAIRLRGRDWRVRVGRTLARCS